MATTTMATAAGMAMLLYFFLNRRLSASMAATDEERAGDTSKAAGRGGGRRKITRRPDQAPATWREVVATLAETLRFTYTETLGKWPIGDLAFGIKYLMRRQGNLQLAGIFAESDCVQLKGLEIMTELIHLLRLLNLCMLFSKKPFQVFLNSAGYTEDDVFIQEPKAGLLKPAFTVICDKRSKCIILLIRGTHSIKDTLTAATGAVVPFHHLVLHEGGVNSLVLGYAHCGMVAAARWIAKCATACLLKAFCMYPDYNVKIIGHSLGAGTAAILTYILRERSEFSSCTCIAFAPAACMTWELAESGKHFITAVINGSDLVPTFSTASVDNLRTEVTSSSWLNDLRDQIEHTRFLNIVYRSACAIGSRLPSISSAKARVAGARALLRPVSNSTQVVIQQAQIVAQAVVGTNSFSPWTCMGARRRIVGSIGNSSNLKGKLKSTSASSKSMVIAEVSSEAELANELEPLASDQEETEGKLLHTYSSLKELSENEVWFELEKELNMHDDVIQAREEEAAAAKEISEEEKEVVKEAAQSKQHMSIGNAVETSHFYPPGRIMHMVMVPASGEHDSGEKGTVAFYETPRNLYNKIRLAPSMINDHYMPAYKKMMEDLIDQLGQDEDCSCTDRML